MGQWNMLYDMYERRPSAERSDAAVPKWRHPGVKQRWAKSLGQPASQDTGRGRQDRRVSIGLRRWVSIVTLCFCLPTTWCATRASCAAAHHLRGRLSWRPGALEAGR